MKAPKFVVIVCCQGQPFYYFHNTLFGTIFDYIKQFLKKKKYHTMRFSLEEVYPTDKAYKIWENNNGRN